MRMVTDYEVVDHGFDSVQYFRGCGVACTHYEDVATGIGDTITEAFEDACEMLAQQGWSTESIQLGHVDRLETVQDYLRSLDISLEDCEETETCYYISIRVR